MDKALKIGRLVACVAEAILAASVVKEFVQEFSSNSLKKEEEVTSANDVPSAA